MSASTQPSLNGITAQAITATTKEISGARRKTALSAPAGHHDLLDDVLEEVGEALQQAEGADHVGPAPQLHRRPDLAVGVEQEGQATSSGTTSSRHCPRMIRAMPSRVWKNSAIVSITDVVAGPVRLSAVNTIRRRGTPAPRCAADEPSFRRHRAPAAAPSPGPRARPSARTPGRSGWRGSGRARAGAKSPARARRASSGPISLRATTSISREVRVRPDQRLAQRRQAVPGQRRPQRARERAQDRPVLARLARREARRGGRAAAAPRC